MASGQSSKEKVLYVGDSRVKKSGRMENIPPDFTSYPGKSEAFVPYFLLKEWMVGVVVLVGFLAWVVVETPPLGYPADPTNASFIPMPDWYFLFLYQFLKYPYVSQDYLLLGILGVPGVMFGALVLAPFLDTGKERRFYRRPIASGLMILSLAAVVYLTYTSWDGYQKQLVATNTTPEHHVRAEKVKEALEAGKPRPNPLKTVPIIEESDPAMEIAQSNCMSCHAIDLAGSGNTPPLLGIGNKYTKEEIAAIITEGAGDGMMPSFKDTLSAEEIDELSVWLAKQTQ
ncbi:c-type cytochrome [Paenibacillus yanchengensis]|uniref:C-type cytochrome n=1 Tax=Paenibacillus yanchengensis TaxID=2035833 RepID=A0ABW4YKH6_9BACL